MTSPDLVLTGGTVLDGTRRPPRRADVAIRDGRIVGVGPSTSVDRCSNVVDVGGLVVAPGFIDAHSHADFTLPRRPDAGALLAQGCTTVVTGNCGFSPWPFVHGETGDAREHGRFLDTAHEARWKSLPEFAHALERRGLGVNVAPLCGHGAARTGVMGLDDRQATDDECLEITSVIEAALDAGAFGVSFGLSYPHGRAATRRELRSIAAAAAIRGAVVAVHLRDEGARLLDAVDEMTSLARQTGCKLQLSHHKAAGPGQRGLVKRSLERVDAARADGLDVAVDAYPYTMGATTLAAALPDWCTSKGDDELKRTVGDEAARRRLLGELHDGRTRFTLPEVWVASASPQWAHVIGDFLVPRARQLAVDPAELLLDIVASEGSSASMLVFCMDPDDVATVLRHPCTSIGSDGWVLEPSQGGHPRNFQTFPQMLNAGFRRSIGLDLTDAVARMTGDVADRFGIDGRGRVTPGAAADLTVFDPERIAPGGDLAHPSRPPTGVELVLVNGVVTGTVGTRTGRVLRRSDH